MYGQNFFQKKLQRNVLQTESQEGVQKSLNSEVDMFVMKNRDIISLLSLSSDACCHANSDGIFHLRPVMLHKVHIFIPICTPVNQMHCTDKCIGHSFA